MEDGPLIINRRQTRMTSMFLIEKISSHIDRAVFVGMSQNNDVWFDEVIDTERGFEFWILRSGGSHIVEVFVLVESGNRVTGGYFPFARPHMLELVESLPD